jgi:hypothetical protein
MGRPLNKKYFGNRNIGSASTRSDDKIGGEGVASITLGGVNNSTGFALYDPIIISAPDLPGGVQATARVSALGASNKITAIEVTEQGSGYISVPTVTENVGGVQGTLTFTAVLTVDTGPVGSASNEENAIICYAKTTTGGTRQIADIIKQVSGTRYKVRTADGVAICKLRTDGGTGTYTMDISAFDTGTAGANEYWVSKLTARNAVLVRKGGGTGGTDFTNGKKVKWIFSSAVAPSGADIGTAIIHNG